MKELADFVDAMAADAIKKYPGRGLDLAILPETTLTSTNGPASQRAIPLEGPVLGTFAALARRHKSYLVVPLDLVEQSTSGPVYSNAAVLFDRRGTVAGIYRKVHPVAAPGRDDLENGITPGARVPRFRLRFRQARYSDLLGYRVRRRLAGTGRQRRGNCRLAQPISGDSTARGPRGPPSLFHRLELLAQQCHDFRADGVGRCPKSKRPAKCSSISLI